MLNTDIYERRIAKAYRNFRHKCAETNYLPCILFGHSLHVTKIIYHISHYVDINCHTQIAVKTINGSIFNEHYVNKKIIP